jgi:release factor glutamine methyltransferase
MLQVLASYFNRGQHDEGSSNTATNARSGTANGDACYAARVPSVALSVDLPAFIESCTARLAAVGIPHPRGDAVRLLQMVVTALPSNAASDHLLDRLEDAVRQREARRSHARISGRCRFRNLELDLTDDVYEPCPSSEMLIEHAVSYCREQRRPIRILDIGTGAGNLLLAALHEMPHSTGTGIDLSPAAILLANHNARRLGLDQRAAFQVGDAAAITGTYDLVLSTLPFLPTHILPTLAPEVVLHDPKLALDGGFDGMRHYRRLARRLHQLTHPSSICLFQLSRELVERAKTVFLRAGHGNVSTLRDAYGFPAGIIIGRQPSSVGPA